MTITEPIKNDVDVRHIELSTCKAFGFFLDASSDNPDKIINATHARNTTPILFKNGIAGMAYLRIAESGILIIVEDSAPFEFDRFQKNPIRNMARIPGEINPVNS